jgi:hypothetical protein
MRVLPAPPRRRGSAAVTRRCAGRGPARRRGAVLTDVAAPQSGLDWTGAKQAFAGQSATASPGTNPVILRPPRSVRARVVHTKAQGSPPGLDGEWTDRRAPCDCTGPRGQGGVAGARPACRPPWVVASGISAWRWDAAPRGPGGDLRGTAAPSRMPSLARRSAAGLASHEGEVGQAHPADSGVAGQADHQPRHTAREGGGEGPVRGPRRVAWTRSAGRLPRRHPGPLTVWCRDATGGAGLTPGIRVAPG